MQKEVRRFIRLMENNWWEMQANEMQHYADRGNSHAYSKAAKCIYGPQQSRNLPQMFKRKDDSLTSNATESLERLREHYSDLFNRNIAISPLVDQYLNQITRPTCWTLDELPTEQEWKATLDGMSNHKSGSGLIPIEVLKYVNSPTLQAEIFQLITQCWIKSEVPDSFRQIIMVSLHKTGDKTLCTNQRGISLIDHIAKALTLLIAHRISVYCEDQNVLPESQCGFRFERSTVDMLLVCKLIQQYCKEKKVPLYLGFIDIAKAYDSIHRPTLWKVLHSIGIPPKMLAILQQLYEQVQCRVRLDGKLSEPFILNQGLKQGCPAACILFNIFFALVIHVIHTRLQNEGVQMVFRLGEDFFDLKSSKQKQRFLK
jgi:hypothetical protein